MMSKAGALLKHSAPRGDDGEGSALHHLVPGGSSTAREEDEEEEEEKGLVLVLLRHHKPEVWPCTYPAPSVSSQHQPGGDVPSLCPHLCPGHNVLTPRALEMGDANTSVILMSCHWWRWWQSARLCLCQQLSVGQPAVLRGLCGAEPASPLAPHLPSMCNEWAGEE